jgi:S-(hydroxymethyl)glutathione dehydrogenase/alcohol dehydrogenase
MVPSNPALPRQFCKIGVLTAAAGRENIPATGNRRIHTKSGHREIPVMKAAVLREVGKPLTIEDVKINKPGPHEVLIRTVAAGVCHSDLHFVEGSYPYPLPAVLGHESAGIVEQVGSEVHTVKPGDHVITCLSAFCGHCEHCLTGHMSRCVSPETKRQAGDEPRLAKDDGSMNQFLNLSSFAEQMLIHEHACVAVRKDMPLDRAAWGR